MVEVVEKTGRLGPSYVDSGFFVNETETQIPGSCGGDRSKLYDAFVLGWTFQIPRVIHVIASLA
jgi:hypothetical protein